jgi:hypothetical protein
VPQDLLRLTLIGDFETTSYAFGEGIPDANEWRARARSHDWIRFTGPVPYGHVFTELLAHDLCIYTSLDESLGWLPIEAGMLGVPVVGARVCAFPELVGDRASRLLVECLCARTGAGPAWNRREKQNRLRWKTRTSVSSPAFVNAKRRCTATLPCLLAGETKAGVAPPKCMRWRQLHKS